jgi:hypothetical protein
MSKEYIPSIMCLIMSVLQNSRQQSRRTIWHTNLSPPMTIVATSPRRESNPSKPISFLSYVASTSHSPSISSANCYPKPNTPSISSAQPACAPLSQHTRTSGVPMTTMPTRLLPSDAKLRPITIQESGKRGPHTLQADITLATPTSTISATRFTSWTPGATASAIQYSLNKTI